METASGVYTDFEGLTRLRAKAVQDSPEALRETAAQFEAIFVQMMLKSMRDASFGGGIADSKQSDFYREIYDKQLAMDLSSKGGLGLAEMLVKQLGSKPANESQDGVSTASQAFNNSGTNLSTSLPVTKIDDFLVAKGALNGVKGYVSLPAHAQLSSSRPQIEKQQIEKQQKVQDTESRSFKDPVDFIKTVWEHAKSAAKALGLAPEVLAAQAALETGWGKFVIRDAQGKTSNNFFGVKADHRWDGNRVSVGTLEFRNGTMKKENALFRAYNSIQDSFNDYVNFLKSNPRYRQALESGSDNRLFTRELQSAGYATDPSYAEKINSILNGDVLKQALQGLTDFGTR